MTVLENGRVAVGQQRGVELPIAEDLMKGILIPPRPSVLVGILNEQAKPDPSLQRISELISKDVALTAGILRVVNSSSFALRTKIASIDYAVRLVGLRSVTNVVTALMLHSAFSTADRKFMDEYWESSTRLAAFSSLVAQGTGVAPAGEAYTLGLLADCGVPIMLRRFSDYSETVSRVPHTAEVTITTIEEEEYGTDHTLVGYVMAKSWELPDVLCQCILRHHETADHYSPGSASLGEPTPYLAVLHVARFLAGAMEGRPASYEWRVVGNDVCTHLGLGREQIELLKSQAANVT